MPNWVYASHNPLNFGIDDDRKLVRSWHVAAPEIIHHEGQYYVASLMDSLKGIKLARLKWIRVPQTGEPLFDFTQQAERSKWHVTSGELTSVFTDSERSNFHPPVKYFIGTAETQTKRFDDDQRGVVESPVVTLAANDYLLYISGGEDLEKLYVALVDADTGNELARCTGSGNNELKATVVHGSDWVGKRAVVRVVDNATGPWGHINFGGIYTDPMAPYRE